MDRFAALDIMHCPVSECDAGRAELVSGSGECLRVSSLVTATCRRPAQLLLWEISHTFIHAAAAAAADINTLTDILSRFVSFKNLVANL